MLNKTMESSYIEHYFKAISLCHSCVTEVNSNNEIIYSSTSPDEIALVKGASEMGFVFKERTNKYMILENKYEQL